MRQPIGQPRRGRGRPKGLRFKFPKDIDWGLPFHKLAALFGCSMGTVCAEFHRRHPGERKYFRITPDAEKESWQEAKTWDWTKIDAVIAEERGITREYVRQIRKGLGLPSSKELWVIDWAAVDWSKSNEENARIYGITSRSFANVRCRLMRNGVK